MNPIIWKTALVFAVASVFGYWTIDYIRWLGIFEHPKFYHAPGPCRRLPGIEHGSEDIQVMENGLAFISSGLVLGESDEYKKRVGRIYLFDYNHPDVGPQELKIIAKKDYKLISPRGISIWIDPKTDTVYLYVISHLPIENIDKFRFNPKEKTLTHLRRFADDPNFHKLNDVVVVAEDKFYYTNFFYDYMTFELAFRWVRWGSLGFYDGTKSKLVDTGLFIPNGAILSKDGKFLYVASLGDEEVLVYRRNTEDNSVKYSHSIKVWSKVDNVDIDAKTGDLWIGTHPNMHIILEHLGDPTLPSPSQILRAKMEDGHPVSIEEIYADDGTELAASSIGVRYGDGMLIGSVVTHALYCDLKHVS